MKKIAILLTVFSLLSVGFAAKQKVAKKKKTPVLYDVRFMEAKTVVAKSKEYNLDLLKKLKIYWVQTVPNSTYYLLVNPEMSTTITTSYPILGAFTGAPDLFQIEPGSFDNELIISVKTSEVLGRRQFTNLTVDFKNGEKLIILLVVVDNSSEANLLVHFRDSLDEGMMEDTRHSLKKDVENLSLDLRLYSQIVKNLANKDYAVVNIEDKVNFNNIAHVLDYAVASREHLIFNIKALGTSEAFKEDNIKLTVKNTSNFFFQKITESTKVIKPSSFTKAVSQSGIEYLIMFPRDGITDNFDYELELSKMFGFEGDIVIEAKQEITNEIF
jgi:hypothetical protein